MMGPLNMHCNMVHYESKTGLELRGLYKAIRIVVASLCQHPQLKLQKVLSRIRLLLHSLAFFRYDSSKRV